MAYTAMDNLPINTSVLEKTEEKMPIKERNQVCYLNVSSFDFVFILLVRSTVDMSYMIVSMATAMILSALFVFINQNLIFGRHDRRGRL